MVVNCLRLLSNRERKDGNSTLTKKTRPLCSTKFGCGVVCLPSGTERASVTVCAGATLRHANATNRFAQAMHLLLSARRVMRHMVYPLLILLLLLLFIFLQNGTIGEGCHVIIHAATFVILLVLVVPGRDAAPDVPFAARCTHEFGTIVVRWHCTTRGRCHRMAELPLIQRAHISVRVLRTARRDVIGRRNGGSSVVVPCSIVSSVSSRCSSRDGNRVAATGIAVIKSKPSAREKTAR